MNNIVSIISNGRLTILILFLIVVFGEGIIEKLYSTKLAHEMCQISEYKNAPYENSGSNLMFYFKNKEEFTSAVRNTPGIAEKWKEKMIKHELAHASVLKEYKIPYKYCVVFNIWSGKNIGSCVNYNVYNAKKSKKEQIMIKIKVTTAPDVLSSNEVSAALKDLAELVKLLEDK